VRLARQRIAPGVDQLRDTSIREHETNLLAVGLLMTTSRKRTLDHLHRLTATAAILGSAACNTCGGSGYAVVDPMPMPTPKYSSSIAATVAWSSGRIMLEMKDPTLAGARFSAKYPHAEAGAAIGTPVGGRVVGEGLTADGIRFELEPDPGRGAMYVSVDVDGPDGARTVEARIDWGAAADGGKSLTVVMVDH
jgi:hypothetical protein